MWTEITRTKYERAQARYASAVEAAPAGFATRTLAIVRRSDRAKGVVVLARRWVVERTFAWLGRNRRPAKDFGITVASAEAWLFLASVQLLIRRLPRT